MQYHSSVSQLNYMIAINNGKYFPRILRITVIDTCAYVCVHYGSKTRLHYLQNQVPESTAEEAQRLPESAVKEEAGDNATSITQVTVTHQVRGVRVCIYGRMCIHVHIIHNSMYLSQQWRKKLP